MRIPLVYNDAPHLGFDLGRHEVKLVQLAGSRRHPKLVGYASALFSPDAIIEGIIADPELIVEAVRNALKKPHYGRFTARRVATGLPTAKTFTRTLRLPAMSQADLEQAVGFEVEQYVPVPIADLYVDHQIIDRTHDPDGDHLEVLMVASPRAIVDSYIKLFDLLRLEVGLIETSMSATVRAISSVGHIPQSMLIMDIGSDSTDISIVNKYTRVSGTVATGGEQLTLSLVKDLGVKTDQATEIKAKFGLKKSGMQDKIMTSLRPSLDAITKEAQKVLKFYRDRNEHQQPIEVVILSGGTANMPGLTDYLQEQLGLPVQVANPWQPFNEKSYKDVPVTERVNYVTAIGLAETGLLS